MKRSSAPIAGVATDPGRHRANNEDLPYVDEREGVFGVIDGIGGEAGGEVAAQTAVDAIRARFQDPGGDTEERLREAIALANNRIYQLAQQKPELAGMACVLTLAVVEGRTVTVGHVGDTRLYRIRGGRAEKITFDHSPIGEREDSGELPEAEAMSHPRRNEVYRDVGSEPHQPGDPGFIDIYPASLSPDAALLICSDGLTDMLTSEAILRVVSEYKSDPNATAQALVDAANEAGGKDNVTVVFIPGSDFAAASGHTTTRRMGSTTAPAAKKKTGAKKAKAPAARPVAAATPLPLEPTVRSPGIQEPRLAFPPAPRLRRLWPGTPRLPVIATIGLCAALILAVALFLTFDRVSGRGYHFGAATLHVGPHQQYHSIKAALADAIEGDSVVVSPGVYAENVLLKSGVSLLSSVPRKAEIQASGTAVDGQTITGARISGFRILQDPTNTLQIGLRARDADFQIDDTEIEGASDAGVVIQGTSTVHLLNNVIRDNIKAGVRVESAPAPEMHGNRICDNGVDVDPPSSLTAATNYTGRCNPELPPKPKATEHKPEERKTEERKAEERRTEERKTTKKVHAK